MKSNRYRATLKYNSEQTIHIVNKVKQKNGEQVKKIYRQFMKTLNNIKIKSPAETKPKFQPTRSLMK